MNFTWRNVVAILNRVTINISIGNSLVNLSEDLPSRVSMRKSNHYSLLASGRRIYTQSFSLCCLNGRVAYNVHVNRLIEYETFVAICMIPIEN